MFSFTPNFILKFNLNGELIFQIFLLNIIKIIDNPQTKIHKFSIAFTHVNSIVHELFKSMKLIQVSKVFNQ